MRGWPFTRGGALRLRRVALPWADLFCRLGAGQFLDSWPFSAGLVVLWGPFDVIRPSQLPEGAVTKKPGQSVAAAPNSMIVANGNASLRRLAA